jgi:N utilization substance protein B
VNEIKPKARRRARQLALQALYQWQMSGEPINEIKLQFHRYVDMTQVDVEHFHHLIEEITMSVNEVDNIFIPFLDRSIHELNPVELAVLRIGAYELAKRMDIPYRVSINEALELSKAFGSSEAHKYVNGVLDKIANQFRKPFES